MIATEVYRGDLVQDRLLSVWHARLTADLELPDMVAPSAWPLHRFLGIFQAPASMVFAHDEHGVCAALWTSPVMGATSVSHWLRRDLRGPKGIYWLLDVYEAILTSEGGPKALLGVTKLPRLCRMYERAGATPMGRVPGMWDGRTDGWIFLLTEEGLRPLLEKTHERRRKEWRRRAGPGGDCGTKRVDPVEREHSSLR